MANTRFENLKIWQNSIQLAKDVYKLTKTFPKEEQFGITGQLRRASVSVSTNISEGAGRESKKDFARFVSIALGSLYEVRSLLILSAELDLVPDAESRPLLKYIDTLSSSITAFKRALVGVSTIDN